MSGRVAIPVAIGLASGIGFILVISLALTMTSIPKEPVMVLITSDGNSYEAYFNDYCGEVCDILALARVVPPDPPIHIDKESDFILRTTNTFREPNEIRFYLQKHDSGSIGIGTPKKEG